MSGRSKFSASGSALGYLFQIEYAFLETLRRLRREPTLRVRLEVLDDVQFEAGSAAIDIVQTKHRAAASLSDRSTDLWKTLRVWAEQLVEIVGWGDTATLGLVFEASSTSAAAVVRAVEVPGRRCDPIGPQDCWLGEGRLRRVETEGNARWLTVAS